MLFTECKSLADVISIFDQVDHVCVTRLGGRVDFLRGDDALDFCQAYRSTATRWRPEYALASHAPMADVAIVAFVVYPKPQYKHAKPSTPAAMAKRFQDATPAEMRG